VAFRFLSVQRTARPVKDNSTVRFLRRGFFVFERGLK
jgi:hypothetical protein